MPKSVTTTVTYKVPEWEYCNLIGNAFGQPSKEKCRFCVKQGKGYVCALYNMPLTVEGQTMVHKDATCVRTTFTGRSVAKDETVPAVDPKKLIKLAIAEYEKMRKQLINQGYPAAMAETLAKEYLCK